MRGFAASLIGVGLLLTGAGCAPRYTPDQRKEMETRILETDKDTALRATISVLQDLGYTVTHSDYPMGVVRAETGTESDWLRGSRTNMVTVTVEEWGEGRTRERITFLRQNWKESRTLWGTHAGTQGDSRVVSTPELLQRVYGLIEREIFQRQELAK